MKSIFQLATATLAFFIGTCVQAQQNSTSPRWGIEIETVAPFIPTVHIGTAKVTRSVFEKSNDIHGDLLLGIYVRPNVEHDVVERIDEYLFTLGYRQYFWRGIHVEGQTDIGYAWGTTNLVDGKDYNNFAMLIESHAGYTFRLFASRPQGLYVIPQIGVIHGLFTNIGPRGGKTDTFFSGKLLVGFAF